MSRQDNIVKTQTFTDRRGVTYEAETLLESRRQNHVDKQGFSTTIRRISDRPVDIKRNGRGGMSNGAKRAARRLP